MNVKEVMEKWANGSVNVVLDLWRILFGLFLFYKGVSLFANRDETLLLVNSISGMGASRFLVYFIVTTHVISGMFISFGFLTRISTMMQLPVLIAAIMANVTGELNFGELLLTIASLVSCLCFMVYGSGKHSADHLLKIKA